MTCGSCSESVAASDHELMVANDADAPAEYTLTFGSRIRQGEIIGAATNADSNPSTASHGSGRKGVRGRHLAPEARDAWVANGPIRLQNTGDVPIRVDRDGRSRRVQPGEMITTSCPTERKRKAALGAVAGGAVATALGRLLG